LLFAIGQPAALAGLLIAFPLAVALRAVAGRLAARACGAVPAGAPVRPDLRRDLDPFGAVAAVLGGTGWGRAADPEELPRRLSRRRRAAVVAAGPVAVLVAGLAALAGYRAVSPRAPVLLRLDHPSEVLRGVVGPAADQVSVSVAAGLVCFAVVALLPLPPLDGFALLWLALRRPGPAAYRVRHWLAENNIGVALLLLLLLVPLRRPVLHQVLDLLATPLLRVWA